MLEAICWRFRTGSPWRDLPADLPAWQTVWWRFDRWAKDGTWDRVLAELQGPAHAAAELERVVRIDSTVARAHQHAAGARADLPASTGGLGRITRFCGLSPPITRSADPVVAEHQDPPQRGPPRTAAVDPADPGPSRHNPRAGAGLP